MEELFHHRMARVISLKVLEKMLREPLWNPGIFDQTSLRLGSVPNTWPLADASLYDDNKKLSIGLEFKPPLESKRGCLTGLGQAIAYLNIFSSSILALPEFTEDGFPIGDYIADSLNANELNTVPIAVVTYPPDATPYDDFDITLKSNFDGRNVIRHQTLRGAKVDSTFYVNWRDTSPNEVFLFLSISDQLELDYVGHRLNKIWDIYWNEYYCPKEALDALDYIESKVYQFDNTNKRISLYKTKQRLRKEVNDGNSTTAEALESLRKKASPGADTNYTDLRKNHFNFMNQLKLWDGRGVLTSDGAVLLSIGKRRGFSSPAFVDALAHLLLVKGDHSTLLYEFNDFLLNHDISRFEGSDEIRAGVMQLLDNQHLIKRNPNRATSNLKKAFQDEFTLWSHLGILIKNGREFYDPQRGLVFNWRRIQSILGYNFTV